MIKSPNWKRAIESDEAGYGRNLVYPHLAIAMEQLTLVAQRTSSQLGGDSTDDMARLYSESGFLVDDAVIRVLAAVKSAADRSAVNAALRTVYLPWVDHSASRLQELTKSARLPIHAEQDAVKAELGQVILFADGLRYDVAQRLAATLEERNLRCSQTKRWAALPSVTATAKPAIAPVANEFQGVGLPNTFVPKITATDQDTTFSKVSKATQRGWLSNHRVR